MSLVITSTSALHLNADALRPQLDQLQPKPNPIPDPGPELASAKAGSLLTALRSRVDAVALNPQPLPPQETSGGASVGASAAFDDDWCGTVPRRIPIPPPPPGPWSDLVNQAIATR